jgi:hypothetical protein
MQLKCNPTLPPPNNLVKIGTIMSIIAVPLSTDVYGSFFNLSLPINATIFKVAKRGLISPHSPRLILFRRLNVGTGKMVFIIAD